jgi:lysophospholipase L1-like esterase
MFRSVRRRVAVVAALLLVAAAGAACESSDPPPDPGFVYAALGDSFTAAPGIPTISNEACQRSDHNYPHLVAKQLDDVALTDVSCGGARSDAVLQSQKQQSGHVQPPQIEAISTETDLITVGFGANDEDYVFTAAFQCLLLADFDPDGAPCRKSNATKISRLLERVHAGYLDTLEAIANRAPDARIIVVGYPRLLSDDTAGCRKRFPIAEGDVPFVRRSFDRLIATVERVAADAGVEYVDVATASEGHDICSEDPWINGKRVDESGAAEYHPMPAEQDAVAALILEML